MENNVESLIREFCNQLLKLVPEFQELVQAKQDLDSDPVSKQLWLDKEEQRSTVELMKNKGLPVSVEQEQKLSQKLKEMRENPITMRYLKAMILQVKFQAKSAPGY